jgi:hypothetical protein
MTNRILPCIGTVAVVTQLFLFLGCGGSNSPSTGTGTAGTTGAAGTTGSGAAGTTGSGAAGTTGSGAAGTTGSGTAGTTGSGTAGTTGSGTAGTTGSGGSSGVSPCTTTGAGTTIAKGIACTASDPQLCTKTCGPEKTGTKTETCTAGAYVEGSVCSFPAVAPSPSTDGTYMCWALPATANAGCPTDPTMAPQASTPCTIADCIVCGGTTTGQTTGYKDSTGAAKAGFCVCQASAASPTWSCASTTAWPCPGNTGC